MNVHTGATADENKDKEELDLETLKKWVDFFETCSNFNLDS